MLKKDQDQKQSNNEPNKVCKTYEVPNLKRESPEKLFLTKIKKWTCGGIHGSSCMMYWFLQIKKTLNLNDSSK